MVVLDSFPVTAADGDILAAGFLNKGIGASTKQAIIARAAAYNSTGSTYASGNGFYFENPLTTYAGVGNDAFIGSPSTAGHGKNGVVSAAAAYDNFYGTTIDSTKWKTNYDGGVGGSIIYQSGNGLAVFTMAGTGSAAGGFPKTTLAYGSGTNSLWISGADAEYVIPFYWSRTYNAVVHSGTAGIVATNGTNILYLGSFAAGGGGGGTQASGGYFRVVYTAASGTANVFRSIQGAAETQIGSNLAITAGYNFIGAASQLSYSTGSQAGGGSDGHSFTMYGIGWYRSGTSSTTVDVVTSGNVLPNNYSGAMTVTSWTPAIKSISGVSTVINTNAGTTYSSANAEVQWGASPTIGSVLKQKISVSTPGSMVPTTKNIPVLDFWAAGLS